MGKALASTVHVYHPGTRERVSLVAGTELPDWAEALVTNPAALAPADASEQAPSAPPGGGEADGGHPGGGTVDDVLRWVGDDAGRARSALLAESGRDRPRTTLVDQLEAIASGE
jgi:hypothetical protein